MSSHQSDPVMLRVLAERGQSHDTRKELFVALEEKLGRPLVSFFTSFTYPVMLEDRDIDMLAGVLQTLDLSHGLALMISSPGGDGLAAERMVNVCRTYSGTGEYWAIVPGKAKSAATMVCFGASKILMGPTSELGSVDPQVVLTEGDTVKRFSAYNIIESYVKLFRDAEQTQGNLEPYLQQLSRYDAREIKEFEAAIDLSKDITIRTLHSAMMSDLTREEIEAKMGPMFLTPESTKTHGRPIYKEEAASCRLNIEGIKAQDDLWHLIYELYVRTNDFVSGLAAKCMESQEYAFSVSPPGR